MLTISISVNAESKAWRGQWHLGEDAIGVPIVAEAENAAQITKLGDDFAAVFEQHGQRPIVRPEALHALGREMHDLWIAPVWEKLEPRLTAADRTLLIRTTSPTALNLPWELVELNGGGPLGCDPGWKLLRTPLERLPSVAQARPGPLRVLFLAAAPTDQVQLDFEREEDAISSVCASVRNVVLRIVDSGTAEELHELVAEFQPHVVHLSGHGIVDDDGVGRFAFENEQGLTDNRDVEEFARDTFRGSSVRCVFLNACQTARAAVTGLAQHLVGVGVPHVLGWSASVGDHRATEFATEFYSRLVRGESLGVATAHARERIRRAGLMHDAIPPAQDATYALPQLYAAVANDEVVDRGAKPEPYKGSRTERYMLGDGIMGLRTGYVGRRREGQRLVPALRNGDKTFALLTGIGGAGKSTLATRASNRLKEVGFRVVPVRVEEGPDPATQARAATLKLFTALATAFELEKRPDAAAVLRNGKKPAAERFALASALLNEVRFLLVLDNLEPALIVETREIADPDLAEGLRSLATDVTRGSRVLVTCRYLPANMPMEQATVLHIPLSDFPQHDVLKFMRRERRVDERLNSGDLPIKLVTRLHADFGGTPGFLEQVRTLLADPNLDVDALHEELEGVEPGLLAEKRQAYYEKIITSRLYAALSPEAQRVAARLALSGLPLPVDAVAALADLDERAALLFLESGVEYGLLQRFDAPDLPSLFQPPGLLRPWLTDLERLPESDALETHRRLAAFWRDAFERDREPELRVEAGLELEACRHHARLGGDSERWCWAAVSLARPLERIAEWRRAYELIEEIPETLRDGRCWHQLATIHLNEGNYVVAREKFRKSLSMQQAIGGKAGEAASWHQLATIDLNEGNYAAARENFAKSLSILQAIGDKAGEGAVWHQLGLIDLNEGHYAAARENFGKSQSMLQAIGDKAGEAATWHNLASIDLNEGNYAAARENFGKSLSMRQAIGDRAGEATTWHQLAAIDANEGNHAAARDKLGKSLNIKQAIGDRAGEANTLHNIASIDVNEGNYAAAYENFGKALSIKQAIGNKAGEAATFFQLGILAHQLQRTADGAPLMALCWLIDRSIGQSEADRDLESLSSLCQKLGYDQTAFESMIQRTVESYKKDHGRSLLKAAFPDWSD